MNDEQRERNEPEWLLALGSLTVVALLTLFALSAIAGWPWVGDFLRSSAAAWVQAIGSVAAIVAALGVVQRQHHLEVSRREQTERLEQQRRARSLRVVFFSAARTCEEVGRKIGDEHVSWNVASEELKEARSRLLSIDPLQVPDGGLLLIIEECTMRLHSCSILVEQLSTPRSQKIQEGVRMAVMAACRECWLGLFEATGLEARLSRGEKIGSDPYAFEDFEESRRKLDQIRSEFTKERTPA